MDSRNYIAKCGAATGDLMGFRCGDGKNWASGLLKRGWVEVTGGPYRVDDIAVSSASGPYKGGGYGHVGLVIFVNGEPWMLSNGRLPIKPGIRVFRDPKANPTVYQGTGENVTAFDKHMNKGNPPLRSSVRAVRPAKRDYTPGVSSF